MNSKFILTLSILCFVYSQAVQWEMISPNFPVADYSFSLATLNVTVAISVSGSLAVTDDLTNWNLAHLGDGYQFLSGCATQDFMWIQVLSNSTQYLLSSTDGITWVVVKEYSPIHEFRSVLTK